MRTLWQRFGRVARNFERDGIAILLAEPKWFDEERAKAAAAQAKRAAAAAKRKASNTGLISAPSAKRRRIDHSGVDARVHLGSAGQGDGQSSSHAEQALTALEAGQRMGVGNEREVGEEEGGATEHANGHEGADHAQEAGEEFNNDGEEGWGHNSVLYDEGSGEGGGGGEGQDDSDGEEHGGGNGQGEGKGEGEDKDEDEDGGRDGGGGDGAFVDDNLGYDRIDFGIEAGFGEERDKTLPGMSCVCSIL